MAEPVEVRRGDGGGTLRSMSTREILDPELQSVVERARDQARQRGELLEGPSDPPSSDLSPAARSALAEWVASGDYDRAVAEIIADDPDLATQ